MGKDVNKICNNNVQTSVCVCNGVGQRIQYSWHGGGFET